MEDKFLNGYDSYTKSMRNVTTSGFKSQMYLKDISGIVQEVDILSRIPRARVWIKGVHDPKLLNTPEELPWVLIELGAGTSKTGGTVDTLYKGQEVSLEVLSADWTKFKIVSKVSKHEPKPKTTSKGSTGDVKNPNSVKAGAQDGKIPTESAALKNEKLTESSLPKLATCYINNLIGTIFTKFNNNVVKCGCTGLGSLSKPLDPCGGVITNPTNPNFNPTYPCPPVNGCSLPVISCGGVSCDGVTSGVCDLSKDMSRMCEPSCTGTDIGNIGGILKVDGYSCDMNTWGFKPTDSCTNSSKFKIEPDGTMRVQPNCPPGTYTAKFDMGINTLTQEAYQDLINLNPDFEITLRSFMQKVEITFKVVEDLQKLDFSKSIDFIKNMLPVNIGPIFTGFKHLPTIEFEMDKKTTDKATFGQLYVNTGPSDLTPSLELDFTVGKNKTSNIGLESF